MTDNSKWLSCLPELFATTKCVFELLKEMKEQQLTYQQNPVSSPKPEETDQQPGAKNEPKDEPKLDNGRLQVKGVYLVSLSIKYMIDILLSNYDFVSNQDAYPFKEENLDSIAQDTTVSVFVRQLMRQTFTFDYLSTTHFSMMNPEYHKAIIGKFLLKT